MGTRVPRSIRAQWVAAWALTVALLVAGVALLLDDRTAPGLVLVAAGVALTIAWRGWLRRRGL